jgi:hypothetical protein
MTFCNRCRMSAARFVILFCLGSCAGRYRLVLPGESPPRNYDWCAACGGIRFEPPDDAGAERCVRCARQSEAER